ncbi:MAG TPA: hypothetical protein VJ596_01835 [Gemmatimonadaceae bacterium]|nr:hypothetical protein [Gemmatimonadaceae bacterium]
MSPVSIRLVTAVAVALAASGCTTTMIGGAPERAPNVVVVQPEHDRRPLGVPPGHLPPPGECRLWFPGRPPGHQPRPGNCGRVEREAPAGAWVLYRPERDRRVVHARVIDPRRTGVVVVVRVYDANRGTYLRAERP